MAPRVGRIEKSPKVHGTSETRDAGVFTERLRKMMNRVIFLAGSAHLFHAAGKAFSTKPERQCLRVEVS